MVTRQEAQAALDAATAERDTIQANLLDLDTSFGKRMLSGASLVGETRERWDAAAASSPGCGTPTRPTRPSSTRPPTCSPPRGSATWGRSPTC